MLARPPTPPHTTSRWPVRAGALTLACALAACAAARPAPASPRDRFQLGLDRVAALSPFTLDRDGVARAFAIEPRSLAAYPGDGTVDNPGGYAFAATPDTPWSVGMAWPDPSRRDLNLIVSLVDEFPRRLATPLPFCVDALEAKARLQARGWRFERVAQAPQHLPANLVFTQKATGRGATLMLVVSAAHEGVAPGDCVDHLIITLAPERP